MITLIEALNYRCLRDVSRPLDRFHLLVGPNASGKSTFLDVVTFLSDFVRKGLFDSIATRSPTFHDLLFGKEGDRFELAVEAAIPESLQRIAVEGSYDRVRYETAIRFDSSEERLLVDRELLTVRRANAAERPHQRTLFPMPTNGRSTLARTPARQSASRRIVSRRPGTRANYYSETYKETGKGWNPQWDLAPHASALANLPADESKFPVATWFRKLLAEGVEFTQLDSRAMRSPAAPGAGKRLLPNGANLPWVIEDFRVRSRRAFQQWLEHLKTALPDLEDIRTVEREEDRHRYLKVCYAGGLEAPAWLLSDGTLRLLALTLPAYLNVDGRVLLFEEPENGIHPRAIEMMYECMSQVFTAQVLVATHSPVILSNASPADVLCFAKDGEGATDIVTGDEHPRLVDWQRDPSLGTLFAAGVLG